MVLSTKPFFMRLDMRTLLSSFSPHYDFHSVSTRLEVMFVCIAWFITSVRTIFDLKIEYDQVQDDGVIR